MPFTKELNKDFMIKDNKIVLSDDYLKSNSNKFKKITGTRFASVVGLSKYTSPVKTWAIMTNLYKDEIDPVLAKVGNEIEPKVRDYVNKITGYNFIAHNPFENKFDIFQFDDVYGGIPDGEPVGLNGKFLYEQDIPMLEIKTTSIDRLSYEKVNDNFTMKFDADGLPIIKEENGKRKEWFNKNKIVIPNEYILQLSLYLYLRNAKYGLFAITFLKPIDYKEPSKYDPNDHEIVLAQMTLNKNKEFLDLIEYGRKWYQIFIKTGKSPTLTSDDIKWLKEELKK